MRFVDQIFNKLNSWCIPGTDIDLLDLMYIICAVVYIGCVFIIAWAEIYAHAQ